MRVILTGTRDPRPLGAGWAGRIGSWVQTKLNEISSTSDFTRGRFLFSEAFVYPVDEYPRHPTGGMK